MVTKIIKNIFNKMKVVGFNIKTQNTCEQRREVNIGPKLNKPLPNNPTRVQLFAFCFIAV